MFCTTGLQILNISNDMALQGRKQLAILIWMDRQLQRDEGVLRRLVPAHSIDCGDINLISQQRSGLLPQLEEAGLLPSSDILLQNVLLERRVQVKDDQLLVALSSAAPMPQQRERRYNLEALGVCKI